MTLFLIIALLILILALVTLIFWVWIFIRGIFSRKTKLPYVWSLYFLICYIFFFSKRIIEETATDKTFIVLLILFVFALVGIYRWRFGKMSWETIEKSWSMDNLDDIIQKEVRGSGLIKFLVKLFGKRPTYYGLIMIIFIFPLAVFFI
jgi:hypothetical protein